MGAELGVDRDADRDRNAEPGSLRGDRPELGALGERSVVDVDAVLGPDDQVEVVARLDGRGRLEVGPRHARAGDVECRCSLPPPPCTAAIVIGATSRSEPSGAIAASTTTTTTPASANSPCGRAIGAGRAAGPRSQGSPELLQRARIRSGTRPTSAGSPHPPERRRGAVRRPGRCRAWRAAHRRTGRASGSTSARVCATGRPIVRHGPDRGDRRRGSVQAGEERRRRRRSRARSGTTSTPSAMSIQGSANANPKQGAAPSAQVVVERRLRTR